jgi:hypothetical protein
MADPQQPMFHGALILLRLLNELATRPGRWHRPPHADVRGDQPLPLVRLRQNQPSTFLAALKNKLSNGMSGPAPHAYVNAEQAPRTAIDAGGTPSEQGSDSGVPQLADPVLPLLHRVVNTLSEDKFGRGQRISFPLYALVDHLTRIDLGPDGYHNDDVLRSSLKSRRTTAHDRSWVLDLLYMLADVFVQGWINVLSFATKSVGQNMARNHVRGLRAQRKWLMKRQPFVTPKHSSSFLGFASRLTSGEQRKDDNIVEQVKLLVVHTFLEDLRRAYRRQGRILPRLRGGRRTAYVMVLLDNINERNGGVELLQLINDVRNLTGELDPLLMVATGDCGDIGTDTYVPPVKQAMAALATWRAELPRKRERLAGDARYLSLAMPDNTEIPVAEEDRNVWQTQVVDFSPPSPPWWARRAVVPLIVGALVLGGIGWEGVAVFRYVSAGCGFHVQYANAYPAVAATAHRIGDSWQCVGYTDGDVLFFGSGENLIAAQERVFDYNDDADRIAEDNPEREIETIVYMAALTHGAGQASTDTATAEELNGLALAQSQSNIEDTDGPLLRIIISNGGSEMQAAPYVVDTFLRPLLGRDASIKAVVGMDRTNEATERAIWQLGNIGVPVIGNALTGLGLRERSRLYFQMSPDNDRLASLVAGYAQHLGVTRITVFSPRDTQGDTYVRTLVAALTRAVTTTGKQMEVRPVTWENSPRELPSMCQQNEAGAEMAFFAGRETDFGDFLKQTAEKGCYDGSYLPHIVAADTVHRFMADAKQRDRIGSSTPISYIGLAPMVVLAGPGCLDMGAGPIMGGSATEAFCHAYRRELKPGDDQPWPAELVGLSYDTAHLVMDAIAAAQDSQKHLPQADRRPVHRSEVAQALREITYHGVTGSYHYDRDRIANERAIAILMIRNISAGDPLPTCVFLLGQPLGGARKVDPATRCPS